jgi:hypothetical protein
MPSVPPPRRSGGGFGKWLWIMLGIFVVSLGITAAAIVFARSSTERAQNDIEELLERSTSGAPPAVGESETETEGDPEQPSTLWDADGARAFAEAFDAGVPGDPTRFVELVIYPDYAIASAQDPTRSERVDRYDFRNGSVGEPNAQSNDDELEGKTFTVADVPWEDLAALMDEAAARLDIDETESRYFIIDKGRFDGPALTIRAYVSGPRESGYAVADEEATIVTVYGG